MDSNRLTGEALKIPGWRAPAGAVVTLFLTLLVSPWSAWGDCPTLDMPAACGLRGSVDNLERQAAHGDTEAMATVGDCYSAMPGLLSRHFAAKWYRRAAESGNLRAQQVMTDMYEFGDGVWANHTTALMWIHQAQAQNPHSAALIGDQYLGGARPIPHGFGCNPPQNALKAMDWLRISAEAGDSLAQAELGQEFVNRAVYPPKGKAPGPYYQEAARWLLSAADMSGQAAFVLGRLYSAGLGVPQSDAQSFSWYRRAAELGVGYDKLGNLYEQGSLVPRDLERAMELYHESVATQGLYAELVFLDRFEKQFGIPSFPTHAQQLDWYRSRAQVGDPAAQAGLGLLYEYGSGVPRNWLVAYALYNRVARSSAAAKDPVPDFTYFAEPQRAVALRSRVNPEVWKLVDDMSQPGNLLNAIAAFVELHPTSDNPDYHPDPDFFNE